jgi:hypothetical protein
VECGASSHRFHHAFETPETSFPGLTAHPTR